VHLTLRARFYWMGLALGDRLVEAVARANLPTRGARLRSVAAASAGGLAAWLAVDLGRTAGGSHAPWLVAGCLALGVVSYVLVQQRVPNYIVLYLAAGLACAAGAFL
jgi:PTS system mannose-specific IID component